MNTATVELQKVAWIREPGYPIGHPAPGRLGCRCGNAPQSLLSPDQGQVSCACGRAYSWDGWLKTEEVIP